MEFNFLPDRIEMLRVEIETMKKELEMFYGSRNRAAKKLKIKPSTLWNRMQKLQNLQYLDMLSNNICTIVTINNWKVYQERENEIEQVNGQRTANELQTN